MSYHSDINGELTFSRALTPAEAEPLFESVRDTIFDLSEETTIEADGASGVTITRRSILGIETEGGGRAIGYGWEDQLQSIIYNLPTDVRVTGMLEAVGENRDYGFEAERLYVSGRTVIKVVPTVTWPDAPKGAQE